MRGTQLASYLKTLPANMIDRVEVIPNPSAKYDPEGMAGIINIVLKSNVDLGLSGGAQPRRSRTPTGTTAPATIGYQSGPFTLVLERRHRHRQPRAWSASTIATGTMRCSSLLSATDQDIDEHAGNNGQNLNDDRRLQARRRATYSRTR